MVTKLCYFKVHFEKSLNSTRVFTSDSCKNASNLAVKMCENDNGWCNEEKE